MRIQQFSWLYFLLLFSLIFFGIHVSFVSGECRTCRHDQMFLLLKLKNNLNVAAAENLVSWDPNTDGCSWRGITCDANGHVISLDLSSHSISNGFDIPTTIFSLQHLQILNLANNNFYSSQIPSGFHKLGNLTYLNLSNSGFSGQIPKAMANLTQLVILDFSHNNLSGKIPSSIGQLRQLELLDLSMNKLNGEIPTEITTLSFLRTMNLSFNQLVGRIPENAGFRKFSEDSYLGNSGLCGFPLTAVCEDATKLANEDTKWEYLAVEIGFVTGLGIVYWPLLFNRRWRKNYFKHVDGILSRVLN